MRSVVTRVNEAQVTIDGKVTGHIGKGLLVLLGVHKDDIEETAKWMADRICGLRIFEDENGKMNISPKDARA
ncbi:MAG: D-aminoacyl-tRNA deacylase, partial [Lachnospiraceae bacterium]|nr:D-aminoacyl-tRNA deacylase [Lachnospiraceae bacterium]